MLDRRFAFLPAALLALACTESVESEDIRTSGIYAEMAVVATGNGSSKVTVALKTGGPSSNTYLILTGKDQLLVTVDGEEKEMDRSGDDYVASFGTDAGGTEFNIALMRGDEDDSAPASVVMLPEPFALTLDVDQVSRADDEVPYSWDPAGDGNMKWEIDDLDDGESCIQIDSGTTPDDGSNAIAAGEIGTFESDEDKNCSVKLALSREQKGTLDEAFTEGGTIVAKHVRTASFDTTP